MRFVIDSVERDYTMVSAPEAETLNFCLKIREEGRFSKTILTAPLGHPFQMSGPHGHFVYRKSENPALFVATGTGIAPFVAFSQSEIGKATLLHGVGSAELLTYQEILQRAIDTYVPCISRQPAVHQSQSGGMFAGHVTDYLEKELPPGIYDFYLCGHSAMIRDATAIIDDLFEDSKLYIENFD